MGNTDRMTHWDDITEGRLEWLTRSIHQGPQQCAHKVMPEPSLSLPGITLYTAAINTNFQRFWSRASRGFGALQLKKNISCVLWEENICWCQMKANMQHPYRRMTEDSIGANSFTHCSYEKRCLFSCSRTHLFFWLYFTLRKALAISYGSWIKSHLSLVTSPTKGYTTCCLICQIPWE